MDALERGSRLAQNMATELGYVRGMSVAIDLARKAGNPELANRLTMLAFQTSLAHSDPAERETQMGAA